MFIYFPDFDFDNWWPAIVGDWGDLPPFSGDSWKHVLVGDDDGDGGGHLLEVAAIRRVEGKTAFPGGWGPEQIGEAAAVVLRAAASSLNVESAARLAPGSSYREIVRVGGARLLVQVTLEYGVDGGAVLTVFPIRGDGVQRVESGRMKDRPLFKDEV